MTNGPTHDDGIVPFIEQLGIPGLIDVHSHFMPEPVMQAVWSVFDKSEVVYGRRWPIEYRHDEAARVEQLRLWRVRKFTSLLYAHKPDMAQWLNDWAAQFAAATPDCLHSATFYPEDDAATYVAQALASGARVFKVHLEVGQFDPRDELLDDVWAMLADAQVPVVTHCASSPVPGPFTGPEPIGDVIARFPHLQVIIAHMGAPEYEPFLAMTEKYANVRLDTAMAFTDFMERSAPFPSTLMTRLRDAGLRGDVLFGSDYPSIPYQYAHQIDSLARLNLGDDWLRKVLYESAAELFTV